MSRVRTLLARVGLAGVVVGWLSLAIVAAVVALAIILHALGVGA